LSLQNADGADAWNDHNSIMQAVNRTHWRIWGRGARQQEHVMDEAAQAHLTEQLWPSASKNSIFP